MSKDIPGQGRPTYTRPARPAPAASRRGLLAAGAGLAGGAMAQLFTTGAVAAGANATLERLKGAERDPAHRVLLKGGMVLSLDPGVGDFENGDVLIGGKKILAVGRNLNQRPRCGRWRHDHHARVCRYPSSPIRDHSARILADGVLGSPNDGKKTYQGVIQGVFTPVYQPEDAYISELVASLNQLNAGVTTTVDTSQVSHTPAHSDACIAGLKESGRRAVYTYSPGLGPGSHTQKICCDCSRNIFPPPISC